MSRFYGTICGCSKTEATRRGHQNIKVSAQSYDGSVITVLNYNSDGELVVSIELNDDTSSSGDSYLPSFHGTFDQLKECFSDFKEKNR